MRNEKATKARTPERDKAGIENQTEEYPLKAKSRSLKPGTTRVTIYRVTAYPTHRKRPKVIRLIGRRRMLITGLIISVVNVKTNPASKSEYVPSANIIPETAIETI